MTKDSQIIKFLKEKGFTISDDLQLKLDSEFTCDKMRSGLQYQINKMRKKDVSTKDAIIGKNELDLSTYEVVYQNISDHRMIVAKINLWMVV